LQPGAFDEPSGQVRSWAAWLVLARCRARLSSMSRIASHNSFTTACRGANGHGLNDLPQPMFNDSLAGLRASLAVLAIFALSPGFVFATGITTRQPGAAPSTGSDA